jgi:hypothetical protein
MNKVQARTWFIGLACLLGTAGCNAEKAAMQPLSDDSPVSATTETLSATPTEALVEGLSDSLSACLAWISCDSSDGAKMIAEQSCQGNEQLRRGVAGTAIAKSGGRASSGTQGDSLEACLTRIPEDATPGQRMLAEESCKRDQLMHH